MKSTYMQNKRDIHKNACSIFGFYRIVDRVHTCGLLGKERHKKPGKRNTSLLVVLLDTLKNDKFITY